VRLHSYVVARDYGFAPNPFYGFCTLATCKPVIRRIVQIGDWVLGTGSKQRNRGGYAVFVMRVTEVLNFNTYWSDPRFQAKKPKLSGSKKQAFGDNIYHREPDTGVWHQVNSHHSHPDGSENPRNIANDTKTDRVLVSNDFTYWGGAGPPLPNQFRTPIDICAGRGQKNDFPDALALALVQWVRNRNEPGYVGAPLDWPRSP